MQQREIWLIASIALHSASATAEELSSTSSLAATATTSAPTPALVVTESPPTGIQGQVTDAKTGEVLIEATVKVIKGASSQALTDVDGNYVLELPPGSYELRVYYDVYKPRRVTDVVVEAGKLKRIDVQLSADEGAIEEVVVEARANKKKAAAVLKERQRAVEVSDAISAEEVGKTPDSSAAAAVKRVVGATVRDSRYVQIRGLGDRYTPTLLNGVPLPSLEPDEYAVPLDILPTGLLSSMSIAKTHRADLPGAFAGGALQLSTNDYPAKLESNLRISGGLSSSSSFRERPSYSGGSLDFFGFDAGQRALPAAVPRDRALSAANGAMTTAQVDQVAGSFNSDWGTVGRSTRPALGIAGSVGNTISLGAQKLGFLLSASFANDEGYADTHIQSVRNDAAPGEAAKIVAVDDIRNQRGTQAATLGLLANGGLELSRTDRIGLFLMYAHNGESRTFSRTGSVESADNPISAAHLEFVSRGLLFSQLTGEHRFTAANNLQLDWQANFSLTARSEPDTRDVLYEETRPGTFRFVNQSGSGERFFGELSDRGIGGSAQLSLPLGMVTAAIGGSVDTKLRNFSARRFRISPVSGTDPSILFLPAEQLFGPDHLGKDMRLDERTSRGDAYDGSLTIVGGFASAELAPLDELRVIAGLRYETATQKITAGSIFATDNSETPAVDRTEGALLPSLNVVYALSKEMNLRASYSYTLARPMFRELAPFLYRDYSRRRNITGQPKLVETRIHNQDLRWEWFFGETEVLSASVFAKELSNPIERIIVGSAQGDLTFSNAQGALMFGAELEARSSLRFLTEALSDFRVGMNLALIWSDVDLGAERGSTTNQTRALQGQAPYIANVSLGWAKEAWGVDATVLFNVIGPRISEVGYDGLLDVYERPFPRLDFVVSKRLGESFKAKLALTNLLNQSEVYQMAEVEMFHWDRGVAGSLALEWTP